MVDVAPLEVLAEEWYSVSVLSCCQHNKYTSFVDFTPNRVISEDIREICILQI